MPKNTLKYVLALTLAVLLVGAITASQASAHPHGVDEGEADATLANGQNHPGFQEEDEDGLRQSCEGELEPEDSGPAGYGLETAHHGPDAGKPGKADGCYATEGDPQDNNPAID